MARKPVVKQDSIELRRWCIEHAMRWPVSPARSSQAGAYGVAGHPSEMTLLDQDVISRAEKLLAWVTK